jgi:hypothetical protein
MGIFNKLYTLSFGILLISLALYAGEISKHYINTTIFDFVIDPFYLISAVYIAYKVSENYIFVSSLFSVDKSPRVHLFINGLISTLFFIYIVWSHATYKKEENDIWQFHHVRHEIRNFIFLTFIMKRTPTPDSATKA